MSGMHHTFNYIELPAADLAAMKVFYTAVFGWSYVDYGPSYAAITGAGMDGGFDANSDQPPGRTGALVVLYSDDLGATEQAIKAAGATISTAQFDFPGGRRFHFIDPSGNELAVWTHL